MTQKAGDINGYLCPECGRTTVVIHVDDGVTPMFLACRADGHEPTEECMGLAVSLMYPPGPPPSEPEWEWYRPTPRQARRMSVEMQEHIDKGGLALRRRTVA
jgi:hypothetical protein